MMRCSMSNIVSLFLLCLFVYWFQIIVLFFKQGSPALPTFLSHLFDTGWLDLRRRPPLAVTTPTDRAGTRHYGKTDKILKLSTKFNSDSTLSFTANARNTPNSKSTSRELTPGKASTVLRLNAGSKPKTTRRNDERWQQHGGRRGGKISLEDKVSSIRSALFPRLNTGFVNISELSYNPASHVYEKGGKPLIFTFWNGEKMNAYIELCLLTIVCHNYQHFEVYNLNVSEYTKSLPFVHPSFTSLTKNHQSDYFRASMLDKYGGIYMDVDTLSFGTMRDKMKMLSRYDFIFGGDKYWYIYVTPLGPIRTKTHLTTQWLKEIHEFMNDEKNQVFLRKGEDQLPWDAFLTNHFKRILREDVASSRISSSRFDITRSWGQYSPQDLMSDKNLLSTFNKTELLTLNNALYSQEYTNLRESQVLSSPLGLSQLLRLSLNSCWSKLKINEKRQRRKNKFKEGLI